jgi:hypothetical protein
MQLNFYVLTVSEKEAVLADERKRQKNYKND